ncbi:type II secretion system protein [Marinobacter sediminum]|uniref:type II secretion system protein n=1 Tax=Marinobacter sediminum TaxID=256323 RepID=UPI00356ADC38
MGLKTDIWMIVHSGGASCSGNGSGLVKSNRVQAGFTLVELVTVMILLGVLASLGLGGFASRSAFSPVLASQQIASATLLAQQAALAGSPSNTLTIQQSSDAITFTVGSTVTTLARNGASLSYRQQSQSGFSTVPSTGYSVTFGSMGRVVAPVTRENINFRITGDSQFDLCLSSLGAVYSGTCQ